MASLTAILGLRKPAGTDTVNVVTDISDNMQILDDAIGAWIPLGVMLPYTGDVAPADPKWVFANGVLVPTATYPDYFAMVGHKYNGGVDPGGAQFRLPSVVDKSLVGAGAVLVGVTAPVGSHAHAKSGAVSGGNATHGHGNTGAESANHSHGLSGSSINLDHLHVDTAYGGGQYSGLVDNVGLINSHGHGMGGVTVNHSHGVGADNAPHGHGDNIAYAAATVQNALAIQFIVKVKK